MTNDKRSPNVEMPLNQTLADWLLLTIPSDAEYCDVANLCLTLYCVVEGFVPSHLHPACNMNGLAEAFAFVMRERFDPEFGRPFSLFYGANYHSPMDKGHWIEVMATVFKMGKHPDLEGARKFLRHTDTGR